MITRAAVKVQCPDGEHIIPCHRHADAFLILKEFGINFFRGKDEQGFLNEKFEFLDRKTAYIEAEQCGQLLPRQVGSYNGDELFSEDLW
jgi:hypothetical protein